jgi:hypothetical protein
MTKARIIFALVTLALIIEAIAKVKPGKGVGFVDGH